MNIIPNNPEDVTMIIQKGKATIIGNFIGKPSEYDMDLSQATKKELLWWIKCLQADKFVDP